MSQSLYKQRRFKKIKVGPRTIYVDRRTGQGIGSTLKAALSKLGSTLKPIAKAVLASPITKDLIKTGLQLGATELSKALKKDPKALDGVAASLTSAINDNGLALANKLLGNGIPNKRGKGLRILK